MSDSDTPEKIGSSEWLGAWVAVSDRMPPPDTWLLVVWDGGRVDKAHTFNKWKHHSHPLGYLIQGHPGAHVDVTHWMPLPQAPNDSLSRPQRPAQEQQ